MNIAYGNYIQINNIYFFYIPIQFFTELNALNRPRRHPVAHSSPVGLVDLHQILILLYFSAINSKRKTPRIIDNPRHSWQGQKDLPRASHSYGSPTVAVQQYPAHLSSLKTVHRTVSLTLRPSRVQVLIEKRAALLRLFHFWQGQKDLNPRHVVLETTALPTELYPYIKLVGHQGLEPRTDRL